MTDISPAPAAERNVVEYTVSEVSQAVKLTLEGTFDHVRVRGEVSRPNYHGSGHLYFTLKDEGAVLDGVCWRGTVARLGLRLEEGMEVVCTGRISSYPRSSRYQIVVEAVELAGEGALLKLLEDRRRKLAAEGLFEAERKRKLPFLPEIIGVVTSPTGAVIRDILHRLADRFPRRVILWPVPVQGEGAAERIAQAIAGFNRLAPGGKVPRPDVLIVARGGGSLEDLWAFNEEVVVRAAAASDIPLISAIGHETDTTLIDFAADVRAPTPTAAAEMAVPVRTELIAQLLDLERRTVAGFDRMVRERARHLEGLGRGLPDPRRLLEHAFQSLDDETDRLRNAIRNRLEALAGELARRAAALRQPREILRLAEAQLAELARAIGRAMEARRRDAEARLGNAASLLESYAYERVLERGFAVVRDPAGTPIPRLAAAAPGSDVVIQFADGRIGARLADGEPPATRPRRASAKPAKGGSDPQGRLL